MAEAPRDNPSPEEVARRVAKLLPGTTVRVEVIGKLKRPKATNRRVGDAL
jgi:hypothetical protein